MLKTVFKNLLCLALPLGLAVGCAENRPQTEAMYGPDSSEMLTPTSSQPGQRIYSDVPVEGPAAEINQVPPGANPANWAIADEIRQRLTSDATLAPYGSSLVASVGGDGVVTLRGAINSPDEQKRVCDTIASLPGVREVKNELKFGTVERRTTLDIQGKEPGDY
jgi:BON domain